MIRFFRIPHSPARWLALLFTVFTVVGACPAEAQEPPNLQYMLGGHTSNVAWLSLSQDKTLFASASSDGTVKIWRVADLMLVRTIPVPGLANFVAFSPSPATPTLLAIAVGSTALVYDISTGFLKHTFNDTTTVAEVALSPDGDTIATANGGNTKLWRLSHDTLPPTVLNGALSPIAFSGDGTVLASALPGGSIGIWTLSTGTYSAIGEGYRVTALAFSPADPNNILATSHDDNLTHVWRAAKGTQVTQFNGGSTNALCFSPNGQILLLSNQASLWQPLQGTYLGGLVDPFFGATGNTGQFLPDGQSMLVGDYYGRIKQYRSADGSLAGYATKHTAPLVKVVYSPDGKSLVFIDNAGTLYNWQAGKTRLNYASGLSGNIAPFVIFSPDSKYFGRLIGSGVYIYQASSGAYLRYIAIPTTTYAFTPDSQYLLTYNINDGQLRKYRLLDGSAATPIFIGYASLAVNFSPDASKIAISGPNTLTIFDTTTGNKLQTLPGIAGIIGTASQLSWSSDGKYIASMSDDQVVRIWSLAAPNVAIQNIPNVVAPMVSFAFSPFADTLTTLHNDGTISLFRVKDGVRLAYYTQETYSTASITYSPDASLITWARSDGTGVVAINPYPVALSTVSVAPSLVQGGAQVTGTVTLNLPAPARTTVNVAVSDPTVASTTASVLVAKGGTSARFVINTVTPPDYQTHIINVTATYNGVTRTTPLTIQPAISLRGIAVIPTTVTGGYDASGVVTIASRAPTGGLCVMLSSDNAAATVPTMVLVPAGKTSVRFPILTASVNGTITANISATSNKITISAPLTITPALIASVSLTPSIVSGGDTVLGTVVLNTFAPTDITIKLSSSVPATAQPDATVVIPAGSLYGFFDVTTNSVKTTTTVMITATGPTSSQIASLTVNSPPHH